VLLAVAAAHAAEVSDDMVEFFLGVPLAQSPLANTDQHYVTALIGLPAQSRMNGVIRIAMGDWISSPLKNLPDLPCSQGVLWWLVLQDLQASTWGRVAVVLACFWDWRH
jgi:hypothetical protein